jgi:ubiquinone/menaquinone biosynthesis C-methylase UbiE
MEAHSPIPVPWLLQRAVTGLSQIPIAFDVLRWGLEGGFRMHRLMLRKHLPNPGLEVLDCGCGTGEFSGYFHSQRYRGIDISERYIRRAKQRHPSHAFEVMDATSLRFPNSSFDAVIVSGVVHHLPDSKVSKVFSEIARVLRKDGTFLLWEDVPTKQRWNVVGSIVHALDMGEFIRGSNDYWGLLEPYFHIDATEDFRSGFMDYSLYKARVQPRSSDAEA